MDKKTDIKATGVDQMLIVTKADLTSLSSARTPFSTKLLIQSIRYVEYIGSVRPETADDRKM